MALDMARHKGYTFVFDDEQRVNLTALWKQTGALPRKKPALWLKTNPARKFILQLEEETEDTLLKIDEAHESDTFGNWKLALLYTAFLSPKIKTAFMKFIRRRFTLETGLKMAIDDYMHEIDR